MTDEDLNEISFVYALLVQDRIIEGVKHVESGSASFNMYFLTEMPKNFKKISSQLRKEFNVPGEIVNKLINVVAFASDSGLLKASRNFLSIHNKGRYPADPTDFENWKDFINQHSYFGQLVDPLFQILYRKSYRALVHSPQQLFRPSVL